MQRITALLAAACAALATGAGAGEVKDLRVENPMLRSPACIVIDDPGPFSHPTSVYRKFGQWALDNGVKGKFSLVPCLGGRASVDGSAGEFPGHTKAERLEWIAVIKKLYAANWSFTPEVATHWFPWDFRHRRMMLDQPVEHLYLASLPLKAQTAYVANAMRLWKNVGIDVDGLTTPWGGWPRVARNTSDALHEVYGKDFAVYFAEYGDEPVIAYEDKKNRRAAVSLRPQVSTAFDAKRIDKGKCIVPCLHAGFIADPSKWKAVERLNRDHGDRIVWMTGRQIGLYYYTKARLAWTAKAQGRGTLIRLSTAFQTPYVTVSLAAAGLDPDALSVSIDGKALRRIKARGKDFAPKTWFAERGRLYVCLEQLKEASLLIGPATGAPASGRPRRTQP